MTDYIDKARRRLGRGGKDVGEILTNGTNIFINDNFHISPTFQVLGVNSTEFPDIKSIDSRVLQIERMGALREVLFRPYEGLNVGAYILFDGYTWLLTDIWGSKNARQKALMQKCNRKLRWAIDDQWTMLDGNNNTVIDDSKILEVMCVASQSPLGSKSNQGKLEIEWNKYDVMLPMGQLYVFVERNSITKNIKLNQRFIFGGNAYQVVGVDDTTMVDENGFGIMQFTTKVTTKQELDDFENGIAYNEYEESTDVVLPPVGDEGVIW